MAQQGAHVAGPGPASRPVVRRATLVLALILALGAVLRFYGLNWDDGHWLHPDERQIYFIVIGLDWPTSLAEALSPHSPLNPNFFAYGSLPIYLLKLVTAVLALIWPVVRLHDNLHWVGRPLSLLFDLGTVYLTYRLAQSLLPFSLRWGQSQVGSEGEAGHARLVEKGALLAASLVGLAVLHVQQAHFYTVDSLLAFFVMLTLSLAADVARGGSRWRQIALGVSLGLALATKVSAMPLAFVVFVAYDTRHTSRNTRSLAWAWPLVGTLALALVIFFLVQPYALIDWRAFVEHTIRETQIARGTLGVPYTIQYAGTWPFLYSMWQVTLWGLALPVGLIAWGGLAVALIRWLRHGPWTIALLLAWAGPYFVFVGLFHTRYLRYMLPLLPIVCILAVGFLVDLARQQGCVVRRWPFAISCWLLSAVSLVYALGFGSIYAEPHPWVVASAWLYQEVPAGSTLATEDWDVALPLPLEVGGRAHRIEEYDVRTLTLYDEPDDAVKWETLAADLADSDYLIVASRRLYGSIPRLPDRYPITTRYYEQLFAGRLGFELVGEFTRGPTWLNPPIPPLADAVSALFRPDESFVVYDHPRALIFYNSERLPAGELLHCLGVQ